MTTAHNLACLLLLGFLSLVAATPLPIHARRDFVELGGNGNNAAAGAVAAASLSDSFVPLGSTSASAPAATSKSGNSTSSGSKTCSSKSGSSKNNNGGSSSSNNNGGSGKSNEGGSGSNSNEITKIKTTKTVTRLSNGDVKEKDCVIKITEEVQGKSDQWVRQGAFDCHDTAKSQGIVQGDSQGVLMCFRAGYVDQSKSQFGGELTVWNVGPSKDLSQAQVEMAFSDGSSLATSAGVLSPSTDKNIDVGTANGAQFVQVGSFHFNHDLPSGASASNLDALAPKSVNLAVGNSSVQTIGLLNIAQASGLPDDSQFASAKWGLFDQSVQDVKVSRRDFVNLGNDRGSRNDGSRGSSNDNNNSGNNGQITQIVEDKQCKTTITKSSGGLTISSGIVIQGTSTTSSSKSENTGSSSSKGSGKNNSGSGGSKNSTGSDTTTTTSSADSSSSTGGVGASVLGFVSSVDGAEVSSVLASVSSISANDGNGANVVATATSTSSGATASNTGSAAAVAGEAGEPAGVTPQADTAAVSQNYQLPGRQLQVLPIGLGVFGGVSVVALVIVGVVTYERRKYRRIFRERRMQEQIAAAGGFGTFDGRMREAAV